MDGQLADPVHEALDGAIDAVRLEEEDAARYALLAAALEEAIDPLRSLRPPDLTEGVLAALPTEPRPENDRSAISSVRWLWTPRELSFQLRPFYGMAAALLLAMLAASIPDPQIAAVAEDPEEEAVLYVQFRLDAPGATRVNIAGTFTGWQPEIELRESTPGVWSALVPLEPGVHDYTFLIDGNRWVADPVAPQVDDGFGGVNSRLFLTRPRSDA